MKGKTLMLLAILLVLMTSLTVYAGNDGNAQSVPYGDVGADKTFGGDAKYYDFLIPYNLSIGDVGGYGSDYSASGAYADWNNYKGSYLPERAGTVNKRAGNQFNIQGVKKSNGIWSGVKTDPNTGVQYVEKYGTAFYLASLPQAPFNYSAVSSGGFYPWASLGSIGVCYDIILKDGTVIHFTTGDAIGTDHSNSPKSQSHTSGAQDGVNIQFADLKYSQYDKMFHALSPCHTFEMFRGTGETNVISRFKSAYNISDSNPIVAIRLWNVTIKNGLKSGGTPTVNSGHQSKFSNKGSAIDGTVSTITPGTNGQPGVVTSPDGQFVSGTLTPLDLSSSTILMEQNLEDTLLDAADRSNLGQVDLEGLTDWERNHRMDKEEHGFIATLRWLVVLVGILMTIWALLVYLAFWFDHINSFFYLDVLHILTFGQLHICPPGDKPTFSLGKQVKTKTVDHKQIICICVTALLFGTMLISGVFYQFVNKLVQTILRWFS